MQPAPHDMIHEVDGEQVIADLKLTGPAPEPVRVATLNRAMRRQAARASDLYRHKRRARRAFRRAFGSYAPGVTNVTVPKDYTTAAEREASLAAEREITGAAA